MHSDIDLLILTIDAVPEDIQRGLIDATYGLYLECGRQISPAFWTLGRWDSPEPGTPAEFARRVRQEGKVLYSA